MPNGQGPLSYMFDSASAHPPMPMMSATAPKTPKPSPLPKTPTTPMAPSMSTTSPTSGIMNKMSTSTSFGLTKLAYDYSLHKEAGGAGGFFSGVKNATRSAYNKGMHKYHFNSSGTGPGLKRYNPLDADGLPVSQKMVEIPFTAMKDANRAVENIKQYMPRSVRNKTIPRVKPLVIGGVGAGTSYGMYKLNQ